MRHRWTFQVLCRCYMAIYCINNTTHQKNKGVSISRSIFTFTLAECTYRLVLIFCFHLCHLCADRLVLFQWGAVRLFEEDWVLHIANHLDPYGSSVRRKALCRQTFVLCRDRQLEITIWVLLDEHVFVICRIKDSYCSIRYYRATAMQVYICVWQSETVLWWDCDQVRLLWDETVWGGTVMW